MSDPTAKSRDYEEVANLYDRQGQAKQRDLFLALAADLAFEAGNENEAERLRQRLMALNPYNLFRPYSSFAEAIKSPDIQLYVEDLRRQFPPSQSEALLRALRKRVSAGTLEKSPFLSVPQSRGDGSSQQPLPGILEPDEPKKSEPAKGAGQGVAAVSPPSRPAAVTGLPANAGRPAYSAPLPPSAEGPASKHRSPDEDGQAHGSVSVGLAVLTLALGAAWLCYTLIEPFLLNP